MCLTQVASDVRACGIHNGPVFHRRRASCCGIVLVCPRHSRIAARSSIDSSAGQKPPRSSCASRGKTTCCSAMSSSSIGCPSRIYFSAVANDKTSLAYKHQPIASSSVKLGSLVSHRIHYRIQNQQFLVRSRHHWPHKRSRANFLGSPKNVVSNHLSTTDQFASTWRFALS
jgi:hypothetical protein